MGVRMRSTFKGKEGRRGQEMRELKKTQTNLVFCGVKFVLRRHVASLPPGETEFEIGSQPRRLGVQTPVDESSTRSDALVSASVLRLPRGIQVPETSYE